MQHLVVLQVVEQHRRAFPRLLGHEDGRARDARAALAARGPRGTRSSGSRPPRSCAAMSLVRPRFQVVMSVNTMPATASGNQPPCAILTTFAAKNARSTARNSDVSGQIDHARPAPAVARDAVEEDRRDGHRAGDRDAVRRREARTSSWNPSTSAMQPTMSAQFTSGRRSALSVCDVWTMVTRGRVAELDRLARERERAGDERLRRDDRRGGRDRRRAGRAPSPERAGRTGSAARSAARGGAARPGRSS